MSVRPQSLDNAHRAPHAAVASGNALSDYRGRKLELAELIRGAMNLASERHAERRHESARELLARLAEDRFQLAVVGQFSRGKSTLMNAILGRAYLPTGALPMTSVITTVHYGSRPRVTVRRRGGRLPIETSLAELVRFVAQSSAEREDQQVVSADVQVPAEILRLGFNFIDTPGIGSAVAANTATTKRYLPEADAVIFVTGFDTPLSEPEVEFLAEVQRHVEKLFVVVNKLDLVSPREADEIVDFIREQVGAHADRSGMRVFAISARDALAAKTRGSVDGLAESRLPELERSLVQFLTLEKARSFLLTLSGRAERLLTRLRFDLELGHAARARTSSVHGRHSSLFEARATELIADQQRVGDRLRETAMAELPGVLAEHTLPWTKELRGIALTEMRTRGPLSESGEGNRTWLREATTHVEDVAPRLFEGWQRRRLAEIRSRLISLASDEIAEIESMRGLVEPLAAETFGSRLRGAGTGSTWSPADLPELMIEPVAFTVTVELPRRPWSRSQSRHESEDQSRLVQGVDAAVAAYVDDVRTALMRATRRWVDDVVVAAQRATRSAADQLLADARNPGSAGHLATLAELEQRLTAFRTELADWDPPAREPSDEEPRPPRPASPRELSTPCEICECVAHVPFDFMAHAQWELARRDQRRAEHIRDGGFCAMHTWQYVEIASDVGIALTYAPLATAAAEKLRAADGDGSGPEWTSAVLTRFLPGPDRCRACMALAEAERDAVRELVTALREQPKAGTAPSLCARHLAAVLAADPGTGRAGWLAQRLADTLRRAAEDMQMYSLKRESLRGHLLSDEEQAACIQVLRYLAGYRYLARPWPPSDEIG